MEQEAAPAGKKTIEIREGHPYEILFTILVATAAVLAGIAGDLAAGANSMDAEAKIDAQLSYYTANTDYLKAVQIYIEDSNLYNAAIIANFEGKFELAAFLMSQTTMYTGGYYNLDGSASSNYSGDKDLATGAYIGGLYETYNLYYEDYKASNNASIKASKASGNYLLASVLLAMSAVFGTVGMSATVRKIRLFFLFAVVVAIAIPAGIIMVA